MHTYLFRLLNPIGCLSEYVVFNSFNTASNLATELVLIFKIPNCLVSIVYSFAFLCYARSSGRCKLEFEKNR